MSSRRDIVDNQTVTAFIAILPDRPGAHRPPGAGAAQPPQGTPPHGAPSRTLPRSHRPPLTATGAAVDPESSLHVHKPAVRQRWTTGRCSRRLCPRTGDSVVRPADGRHLTPSSAPHPWPTSPIHPHQPCAEPYRTSIGPRPDLVGHHTPRRHSPRHRHRTRRPLRRTPTRAQPVHRRIRTVARAPAVPPRRLPPRQPRLHRVPDHRRDPPHRLATSSVRHGHATRRTCLGPS